MLFAEPTTNSRPPGATKESIARKSFSVSMRVAADSLEEGQRSRVTIALDFTGHGIGKLIVPLVIRPRAAREMTANMQRLEQRLEAST